LTGITAPVTVTGAADRVYRFSSTNDGLSDHIEKSVTMSILANCKPFSGDSPSEATSFTQELASRMSKLSPVRFHAKINTNGRHLFYCRCKIDENSAYFRISLKTATELKLDSPVKAHDVEMSLFGNALTVDLCTFIPDSTYAGDQVIFGLDFLESTKAKGKFANIDTVNRYIVHCAKMEECGSYAIFRLPFDQFICNGI